MPSTPTTKSQVQAYRFVLRRMQSALVRKDAVMLHDPMRTHSRATIVGVCLAAVGVVGFLVWGILSPDPAPPNDDGIVISKQTGQVYVYLKDQRRLIPTFNLASARLYLVARQQQNNNQGQAGGQQAGGGAAGNVVQPTIVDEKELKDIPRGRMTGIRNGPDLLPNGEQRPGQDWAVCDAYRVDPSLPNPVSENKVETTVLAGVHDLGPELAESHALLVRAQNAKVYLVYRTPVTANIKNANAVRAEVDMGNPSIKSALKLNDGDIRVITTGMLNAIPEAPKLAPPAIAGRGTAPNGFDVEGLKVGAVFQVVRAGEPEPDYYVLLRDGIKQIKRTTADLIRFTESLNNKEIAPVAPDAITGVSRDTADGKKIDDSASPQVQPEVLTAQPTPVACLGWEVTGEGVDADHHTAVHVGTEVPLPKKSDGTRYTFIDIATPSSDGQRIDHFFMPPGRAAVVRGSRSKEDFGTGPIYLISDRGVKYGVPDAATAEILGLSGQKPAYYAITNLLPDGASLNTRDVQQTYDSVPVGPGRYDNPNGGG
ncbi:MAG TPA: type VII secretion protein EccB [Actinophytocola sp.]|jgi:type VII secretion protein EccB|uniref:type VII secretion protein EccB n=1 Tax=Actinophytocola sp. TaxID=1872138 RepID=UPI002E025B6A|nr:type VII secretion protein EccB [Actinophytocola sp.]